ncbi:hypothetical protein HID58_067646 [Brassica napus]|uniref:Uncharacterized protein n=1 Tax=Brassica napus TaxID=3708 RepID=A0ABQ7ZJI2_BRANA|nr:hypothetical protein HID58_067646 [Brassica napus]
MDSDEVDIIQLQTLQPYHPGKILSIKEAFVTLTIYLTKRIKEAFNTYNPIHDPIMTIVKPHLEKVQVVLEPYTKNVRHGFKKLVESTKVYHRSRNVEEQGDYQTGCKNGFSFGWGHSLIGSPLIFIIKLLSAVSNQIVLRGRRDTAINKNQSLDIDEANTAQLLKACGTTPGSPVKLRKASENLETPQRGKQFTSSQFDSWISTLMQCLTWMRKHLKPMERSCITDSQNSAKISTGYSHAGEESQGSIGAAFRGGVDITTKLPLTATGKRKSVRFECDFDQSYLYIGLGCHYYGNERAQVRILVIHHFSHKSIFHTPYGLIRGGVPFVLFATRHPK